ncbi:alpha/beta hydrolase [Metabacillus endolithicus]|uniref:Alpha/beta hydrolase n=1 Tax=Metabacillus endolithicus TaxID=1535204 RepID=A0ABW5C2K5_9BACI|nr:esterase family protein [Metabacillus endolithicus]UPG62435.1 esterase family protein [Metabacillus endolithicus]
MSKQTGIIKEHSFYSEALQEELTLLIYLPENYSPLYKYSLLIAQDGQDYFKLGRVGRQVEALVKNEEIEDVIVIGIPYKDVHDRKEKYHPNGSKFKQYVRFLAHELVPYLDSEFPTYQIGFGRALIGDSLGATVSLLTGLAYPNTFGKLILQSPLVNEDVMNAVKEFDSSSKPMIYHQIGKKETEVKTTDGIIQDFLTPNRKLSQLMSEKGFSYTYEEFNGDHTWKYWQPALTPILKLMFE